MAPSVWTLKKKNKKEVKKGETKFSSQKSKLFLFSFWNSCFSFKERKYIIFDKKEEIKEF